MINNILFNRLNQILNKDYYKSYFLFFLSIYLYTRKINYSTIKTNIQNKMINYYLFLNDNILNDSDLDLDLDSDSDSDSDSEKNINDIDLINKEFNYFYYFKYINY